MLHQAQQFAERGHPDAIGVISVKRWYTNSARHRRSVSPRSARRASTGHDRKLNKQFPARIPPRKKSDRVCTSKKNLVASIQSQAIWLRSQSSLLSPIPPSRLLSCCFGPKFVLALARQHVETSTTITGHEAAAHSARFLQTHC